MVPERLTSVVIRLTPAFFSAVQHDLASLKQWVYQLTEAVSLFSFPALVGLAIIADDAVRLAAGPKWVAAVLPLRLLAIYGAYDVTAQLLTRALNAAGDSRFPARVGLLLLFLLPPAFVAGSRWGPSGIACAWLIVTPAARSLLLMRARRRLGIRLTDYARALWPAMSATMLMALATIVIAFLTRRAPLAVRTGGEVLVGAAVYSGALLGLHRRRIDAWRREWIRLRAA